MELKLDNINNILNLNFKSNEITSIIGKNGSGKTDILNIIYGFKEIQEGNLKFGKNIINNEKKIKEFRKNISYLTEDFNNQLFNINIKEDIKYGLDNFDKEKLNELLKLFSLDEEILSKNYSELSSGEIKKILLISAILKDSKIILLDNPTSNLDNKSIQSLIKILKRLKRKDKLIIIVSYDSDFLLQVSDRVIVIDNKKVILDGKKFDILSNEKILNKIHLDVPSVIRFENRVLQLKNIKLGYRDNINDLIKDIYRNAK